MNTNIEEIKRTVSIIDIAGQIGLTPIEIGAWYTLAEHDSVRIDPQKNLFIRNSTGESGSVIDFIMTFTGCDFRKALEIAEDNNLYTASNASFDKTTEEPSDFSYSSHELSLPSKDTTMKNVFAYLIKQRCIDKEIVQLMVDKKMLYQDEHKNCVFVSMDENGKPIFANRRGTNTYKRFVQDISGSNYDFSFFIDNKNEGKTLVVTESVIDALSVMSLYKRKGKDYKEYDYLAISGVSKFERPITYHTNRNEYRKMLLCLDNDDAGNRAAEDIKRIFQNESIVIQSIPPKFGKDYNELLQIISKEEP